MPSVIHANINGTAAMSKFQESQKTYRHCTDITYTVFSRSPLEIIELSVASVQQLSSFTTALSTPQEVFVHLLLCPLGRQNAFYAGTSKDYTVALSWLCRYS